jgi:tight adherence protein B
LSGFAAALLGLAAWFAARAHATLRHDRLIRRVSPPEAVPAAPRTEIPEWVPWCVLGAIGGLALGGLVVAALGGSAAVLVVRWRAHRRARALRTIGDEQLADSVSSIAAALRAGRSVAQAVSFAAAEAPMPIRDRWRSLDDALAVGAPFDEAVTAWGRDLGSDDARLVAGVLRLHRRSGGDLPSVLDGVGETLRQRRAAASEIRALTAQARLSGTILGVLPFGFFAFLWLTSRSEIEGAVRTPAGLIAVVLGLSLEGVAFLWIRHLLEVR